MDLIKICNIYSDHVFPYGEERKYMSRHQKAGQTHNLLTANKYSDNVSKFRYLVTTLTSQNCIRIHAD